MKRREAAIEELRLIAREYRVALAAAEALEGVLENNPSHLGQLLLDRKDFGRFRAALGATYLVRLFAAFEAALRSFWEAAVRNTSPIMRSLLKAIASRRKVPQTWYKAADAVREMRNDLVHADAGGARAVDLAGARSDLAKFLSQLPANW